MNVVYVLVANSRQNIFTTVERRAGHVPADIPCRVRGNEVLKKGDGQKSMGETPLGSGQPWVAFP